jgi:hypothetical protein
MEAGKTVKIVLGCAVLVLGLSLGFGKTVTVLVALVLGCAASVLGLYAGVYGIGAIALGIEKIARYARRWMGI